MNIIACRTQKTHYAGSTGESLKASFPYTFSVITIRALVERRGFNQVLKTVKLGTVGWWRVWGLSSSHALFMPFLLFRNTLVTQWRIHSHCYRNMWCCGSRLVLVLFKHAKVCHSSGCPAALVNLRGIPPHATHQHVIGDLVRFAAPL